MSPLNGDKQRVRVAARDSNSEQRELMVVVCLSRQGMGCYSGMLSSKWTGSHGWEMKAMAAGKCPDDLAEGPANR